MAAPLELVNLPMWLQMTSALSLWQSAQAAQVGTSLSAANQAAQSVYLATGANMTYRVATFPDLPTSGVTNGQTALVLTTGGIYLWSGGQWGLQTTLFTEARIKAGALNPGELMTPTQRIRQPLISFQLDDGYVQDRTVAYPIFQARNMKASICVITNVPGDPAQAAGFMRWDDIRWFRDQGWDVASHTVTHVRIDSLTAAQLEFECAESLRVMRAQGLNPTTLVYPQAYHNAQSRAIVRKYFRAGIAGIEPTEQNSDPLRTFAVARRPIQNARTLAQYKADVDKCLAEGTWLVYIVHTGYDLDATQQQNLADLLDYIQSLNIRVATVAEGLDIYGNLYESGDTAGTQWTAVTAQGDLTSSTAGKQRISQTTNKLATNPTVTVNNATPLSAFEAGVRTVNVVNSSDGSTGLPSASGILTTDRTAPDGTLWPLYCWQEWRDYLTSKRWIRKPLDLTTWAVWEQVGVDFNVLPANAYISTVTPDQFPQGKITRHAVTSGSSAGFPTSAGTLETDTTVPIATGARFVKQTWTDYATGQTYGRVATAANAWEAAWTAGGGAVVVTANNGFTNASLPNAFASGKLYYTAVTSNSAAGFPTTAGMLITDATTAVAVGGGFVRQTWTAYATGTAYTRTALNATAWGAWTFINAAFTLAANTVTATLAYDQFPDQVVSYATRTSSGIANGFPTDSGTLSTDRTNYTDGTAAYAVYVRQEWRDRLTGKAWHRAAASGTTWTAWLAVSYGTVTNFIKFSITYDLPSVAAGAQITQDFTYTGVAVGDNVVVNAPGLETGLFMRAEIPATNTIRLYVYNATAAAIDPANRTFTFRVIQ